MEEKIQIELTEQEATDLWNHIWDIEYWFQGFSAGSSTEAQYIQRKTLISFADRINFARLETSFRNAG